MSQTLQCLANVGLGNAKFQLIRRGQHLETTLIFAPLFLIYLHHPHTCSIIPRIGLSSPHAPKQRRVSKFGCCQQKIQVRAKRRACPLPWPPWTTTTSLIRVPIVWAWGLHPSLAWSLPCLCTFATQPNGPCSLRTWATLRQGAHPPSRQKAFEAHEA